ncbi:hypothetical protein ACFPKZ_13385 [Streptosporangium amethystogenes subsp. fukuiense]|uniref:hypothetical protein n=1 Tax=Streptosporangium TaxID=2000 RepID=UPI0031DE03B1
MNAPLHVQAEECSDATAEKHAGALGAVQQLLKVEGVHSYAVHTIGLKLSGEEGRPILLGKPKLYAPELVVCGGAGSVTATVTMGARSGCYLVSLRDGPDLQTVREPQQVANLILTARPGSGS